MHLRNFLASHNAGSKSFLGAVWASKEIIEVRKCTKQRPEYDTACPPWSWWWRKVRLLLSEQKHACPRRSGWRWEAGHQHVQLLHSRCCCRLGGDEAFSRSIWREHSSKRHANARPGSYVDHIRLVYLEDMEWCIRQPCSSSVTSHNNRSIPHKHYTQFLPLII